MVAASATARFVAHRRQETVDDGGAVDAFGLGLEVREDAVGEDGMGDGFEVFEADEVAALENGAGFCMAVAIEKQDCELFAIGVNEERCYWVPLPGIEMSEFNQPKSE